MRRPQIEILEEFAQYMDEPPSLTPVELGIPVDLTREDLEEEDLGLRGLYENPEAILGESPWPRAA